MKQLIRVTVYIDDPRAQSTPPDMLEELVDKVLGAADKHAGFTLTHGSDAVFVADEEN